MIRASMFGNLLMYTAVSLILVATVWLAGRVIGLDRPSRGPTGYGWLDAEASFDQMLGRHRRHRLASRLRGQPHRLDLPIMNEATVLDGRRGAREVQIPIAHIAGTAGGADGKFDRDFLPTDERSRRRFQALLAAVHEGEALAPIEVYRLHGGYYVVDGHHRVAVARALGETYIAAYVTDAHRW